MVEGTAFETRQGLKPLGGSNPPASAKKIVCSKNQKCYNQIISMETLDSAQNPNNAEQSADKFSNILEKQKLDLGEQEKTRGEKFYSAKSLLKKARIEIIKMSPLAVGCGADQSSKTKLENKNL